MEDRVDRLDREISLRLEQGERLTVAQHENDSAFVASLPQRILLAPPHGFDLHPEYSGRSLRSLLVELSSLVNGSERACVEKAVDDVTLRQAGWLSQPLQIKELPGFLSGIGQVREARWSQDAMRRREENEPACKYVDPAAAY